MLESFALSVIAAVVFKIVEDYDRADENIVIVSVTIGLSLAQFRPPFDIFGRFHPIRWICKLAAFYAVHFAVMNIWTKITDVGYALQEMSPLAEYDVWCGARMVIAFIGLIMAVVKTGIARLGLTKLIEIEEFLDREW